nr:hypothetical protein [Brevibacterium sp. HMSC063G07]
MSIVTVMSSGMMIAVPIAWATRASSMITKFGASAAPIVPTRKMMVAKKNTDRVVNLPRIHPVMGSTIAMVRRNPVRNH